MTKKQILQILNDRSTYILDFKDETHNAIELEDFNYVADAILSLYSSSLQLKENYTQEFEEWLKKEGWNEPRNIMLYNKNGSTRLKKDLYYEYNMFETNL